MVILTLSKQIPWHLDRWIDKKKGEEELKLGLPPSGPPENRDFSCAFTKESLKQAGIHTL